MFGIGKKKEMVDKTAKVEKRETEEEIQFDFEENDKLPFDDEEGFPDEGFADDEEFAEEPPRKALSQRTLLLVLLLLLIGGGGYYFLSMAPVPPLEPPKPAPVVKATVVVQPAAPAPAVAVKPASPTPVAAPPAKGPQPVSAVAVKPTSPAPDTAPAAKSQQPAVAAAAAPAAKGEVATSATPSVPSKHFTLSAGSFISQSNLRAVEKKIRGLGYTPKVQSTYSMVPMTRLLLGVYDDPAAAMARSRELSALVPDLFSMKQGESVALYAGSFQALDEARRFADRLYKQGILVDEETVSLRMAVKNLSYGSFASRAAAEKAAKSAATVGLTAQVVKR